MENKTSYFYQNAILIYKTKKEPLNAVITNNANTRKHCVCVRALHWFHSTNCKAQDYVRSDPFHHCNPGECHEAVVLAVGALSTRNRVAERVSCSVPFRAVVPLQAGTLHTGGEARS